MAGSGAARHDRMIVWHFLYDLSAAGLLPPSLPQNGVMELFRLLIAGSFVSISGVCAALSRRPLRRGLIVFAAALLVSGGAWRIHGGGFAGCIQCLVPEDRFEAFRAAMDGFYGGGACFALRVRPFGAYALSETEDENV